MKEGKVYISEKNRTILSIEGKGGDLYGIPV